MPSTTRSVTTGLDTQPSFSQYLGKRVSFEGCIVDKLFSSDKAMTVEVEEEAWNSTVGPAMQVTPPMTWQDRARFMRAAASTKNGKVKVRGKKLASNVRKVKVCGKEVALLKNGQRCVFTGSWAHHTRYGLQLKVESVKILALDREEDILARLAGLFKVIAGGDTLWMRFSKKAQRIYQVYGKDTVSVLNSATAEEKLLRVPRLGGKKMCTRLKKEWDKQTCAFLSSRTLKIEVQKPPRC
ncbi:hypothetical protein CEUSTIGMA_g6166.t1 [Chlamydomonas eustigma]|uniref:ATP-dependent RecD2 DNA helicase OB-fold domain-containing protein n=1 Tax=Chlamydomonas eustigma TaxID=1157962 RepID=A0A250X735_9CHLO|nr:hypothetical protein CEUSTIGMA_g6166.t1 [Chlamydomonas eustigma]|eukprot:GAX78729.1 hypothetical protein CEUSTIGMA_g6166.t1 [Chlamydomonas eustigma]